MYGGDVPRLKDMKYKVNDGNYLRSRIKTLAMDNESGISYSQRVGQGGFIVHRQKD